MVPRAKACGPNNIYRSPSVPFDGRSTNKQHYVPHWGHRPAESCKPQMQAMHCDSPFDDSTMYRADYTPKYFEPCPASLLNTKMSSYRFQQEVSLNFVFVLDIPKSNCTGIKFTLCVTPLVSLKADKNARKSFCIFSL